MRLKVAEREQCRVVRGSRAVAATSKDGGPDVLDHLVVKRHEEEFDESCSEID